MTRAEGFGIPFVSVDGADFFAVAEAAAIAIERARNGNGPSFIQCDVPLFYAHFEGDQETYRAKDEVGTLRAERDCLTKFCDRVIAEGRLKVSELNQIQRDAEQQSTTAIANAQAAAPPSPAALLSDVYGSY